MASIQDIRLQIRSNSSLLSLILLISSLLIGIVLALHFILGIPIKYLMIDIGDLGNLTFYAGFISQIGIFIWSATVAICVLSVIILRHKKQQEQIQKFLLVSAAFTLFLAFDDAFMLHERVLPHIGLSDNLMAGIYAFIIPFYIFFYRKIILKTDYLFLFLALALFASSIFVDMFIDFSRFSFLFEDGPKITGILCWGGYFYLICVHSLKKL